MIERTCPNCGKTYQADPTRLKHGRQTTCSRACSYALRAAGLRNTETVTCAHCGKAFHRAPAHRAKVKHATFCSRECHYAGRGTGVTRRVVTKPYVYTTEGKAALIAASRRPKGRRAHHETTCLQCGKVWDDLQGWRKRKSGMTFCSLACCNTYRKGANNPAWRGGYPGYYGPDWRGLRRAARLRDAYTCRRCGKDQKPPHRAPDVHHVVPVGTFADPNDANTLGNVVCLCHSCHMFAEWHGIDFSL